MLRKNFDKHYVPGFKTSNVSSEHSTHCQGQQEYHDLLVVLDNGWSVHSKCWTFQNQVHNVYLEIFSTFIYLVKNTSKG